MVNPGNGIQLRGSAKTNVGRVRSHNEDNIHLWANDELMLAIVADGMGGAAAGEEASRIAVETITDKLGIDPHSDSLDIPENILRSAVKAANVSIMREAVEHPMNRGMGTTVTMVYIRENMARFAHVGDSRAYRVNKKGEIEQITADHSFVQALLDAGHITEEQAETHPMSNVLYRALGQTEDLDVDTYNAWLHPGDTLVLCSDGLTRHVRAKEIAEIVHQSSSPEEVSQTLINLANERGGEDNISVIVISVEGEENPDGNTKKNKVHIEETPIEEDDTLILSDRAKQNRGPSASASASSQLTPPPNEPSSRSEHFHTEATDNAAFRESVDSWNRKPPNRSLPQTGELNPHELEGNDASPPK